jgi:hypothetical protein
MSVLVHTGALYALLDRSDDWHALVESWWTIARERVIVPAFVLPIVTQVVLKRLGHEAEAALVRSVASGELPLEPAEAADVRRAADLLSRSPGSPLRFVDASLVAMAERLDVKSILTTTRERFAEVRPAHVERFRLVP